MKIAVVSESSVDEAAIKIIIDAIIGIETEVVPLRPRPGGWSQIFIKLPKIVETLYYSVQDVRGLIVVMDSDDETPHQPSHDEPHGESLDCRLCLARSILRRALAGINKQPNRPTLKIAIGLAVPEIEAWYRCGIDPRVNEAAWIRKLKGEDVGYDRRSLKLDTYGSHRIDTLAAIESAKRIAGNLELLIRLFPHGFGSLVRDVRGWLED